MLFSTMMMVNAIIHEKVKNRCVESDISKTVLSCKKTRKHLETGFVLIRTHQLDITSINYIDMASIYTLGTKNIKIRFENFLNREIFIKTQLL